MSDVGITYFQVDGFGEPARLEDRPTMAMLKANEGSCFLSAEIIRGDEIILRRAVILEATGEDEEDELDWEMIS